MIIGDVLRGAAVPVDPAEPGVRLRQQADLDLRGPVPGRRAPRCSGRRPRTPRYRTWCRRTSWSRPTSTACSPRSAPRRSPGSVFGAARPGRPGRSRSANQVNLALYFNAADVRRVRAHHLLAQGDPQAQRQRAHLGAVGGQVHLGGLEVPRPDHGGARPGDRDGRRVRGRRGGGRASGPPTSRTRCTAAARAGARSSPRSSSASPLGMFLGLRILRGFSRRRLFGLSIVGAGRAARR